MIAFTARLDISDHRDLSESADTADSEEPMDSSDANDPALPIEAMDPTLPIDRIDPRLPIERMESCDHSDHSEPFLESAIRHIRARAPSAADEFGLATASNVMTGSNEP